MGNPSDESAFAQVQMSLDGKDWRDVSAPVQSLQVEDHDRLTDEATVVFDDATGILADLGFEGLLVRLTLGWQAHRATIFEGVVISTRVLAQPGGQSIELTLRDFSHRMAQHPYEPMEWQPGEPLSAVLKRIVTRAEYGLAVGAISLNDDPKQDERRPHRPADLSEWDFVLAQARAQGCLAFVEFGKTPATGPKELSAFFFVPVATLAAKDPVGTLNYCRGSGDLVEFHYERISTGAVPIRSASTVDPTSGTVIDEVAGPQPPRPPQPPPALRRDRDLIQTRRAALKALAEVTAAADAELKAPVQRVSGQGGGSAKDAAARVMRDPTRTVGLLGKGVATGNVLLRAKSRVEIKGVAPWAEGEWYLTKVIHAFTRERLNNRTRSSYYTRFIGTR